MTAIVGIKCKDGIVIGSDSSSTFTQTPEFRTIEQKTKKVEIINRKIILAGTGSVGLNQRFSEVISQYWAGSNHKDKTAISIGKELSQAGRSDFVQTGTKERQYGALVAFSCKNELHLCEFSVVDFQPEFKTDKMWFVSMGSGQPITDPFLGLMRRVFWGDEPPRLNEAIFAVAWTLRHVIELNPGGINGPQQIAVLEAKSMNAHLLQDDELAEHIEYAEGAEKHLASYREILRDTKAITIPSLPAFPTSSPVSAAETEGTAPPRPA